MDNESKLTKDNLHETSRILIDEQVNQIPEVEGSLAGSEVLEVRTDLDATFTPKLEPDIPTKMTP